MNMDDYRITQGWRHMRYHQIAHMRLATKVQINNEFYRCQYQLGVAEYMKFPEKYYYPGSAVTSFEIIHIPSSTGIVHLKLMDKYPQEIITLEKMRNTFKFVVDRHTAGKYFPNYVANFGLISADQHNFLTELKKNI